MSDVTFYDNGKKLLAGILAGSGKSINGMYVECDADDNAVRTYEYFKHMAAQGGNFARVPVTHAYVTNDGDAVSFDALVCAGDFKGMTGGTHEVTHATLICMQDQSMANDVPVCTLKIKAKAPVTGSSYVTVHTSMKVGA